MLVTLDRTGEAGEIEFSVGMTALGLVSRLEHALDHFDAELAQHRRTLAESHKRITDYTPRIRVPFASQGDLDAKTAEMAALEASLAQTSKEAPDANLADEGVAMPRLRSRAVEKDAGEAQGGTENAE